MTIFNFILGCLCVWRISHLISKEDGPFDLIYLLRKKAGAGFFGSLLDCFYCTSVWVALPAGMMASEHPGLKLLYWCSLSGAACLLEQATTFSRDRKEAELHPPEFKED